MGKLETRAADRLAVEGILWAVGEGTPLSEALKSIKRTRRWLDNVLGREDDLRLKLAKALPSPQDELSSLTRYIALIAGGSPQEAALEAAGLNLASLPALVARHNMSGKLDSAKACALVVHGVGGGEMAKDTATLLLSQLHPWCVAQRPPSVTGKDVNSAWPPLDDLLATVGMTRREFDEARAADKHTWDSLVNRRQAARSAWMSEHKDHLRLTMMGSLGEQLGPRQRVNKRMRKRKIPMLVANAEGKMEVQVKEDTVELMEQITLEASLPAMKYFHELDMSGGINTTSPDSASISEEDAAEQLEVARMDADDFLLLATGGSVSTASEDWMLGEEDLEEGSGGGLGDL